MEPFKLRTYLLHLRPRSWPIVLGHFATGVAVGYGSIRGPMPWLRCVIGGALWAICLNGGTLALNSAFDRDEGDIGYLDNPPPVPRGLALLACLLMTGGLIAAIFFQPRSYAVAYGVCAVLSVIYSVPPIRLKAVAGPDVVINMIGYGALSFAAGALSAGITAASVQLQIAMWFLAAGFGVLFGAFYPTTQIYQIEEDIARGDRTLVVQLGAARSLTIAKWLVVITGLLFTSACAITEMKQFPAFSLGLIVCFFLWYAFFSDWRRNLQSYPAKAGMYRALSRWAATDVVVAAIWVGQRLIYGQ